jgi:hypothetical protein
MSELQPIVPAEDGAAVMESDRAEPPEPAPITEQEVGEYREQDRFLPVSLNKSSENCRFFC